MAFLDSYVVIAPDNVHFGIVAAFDEGINYVIDAGKGGFVFDRMAVYFSIILDQSLSSILFGNEETGRGIWRFGWVNFACLQFFVHKFIECLLLYRGHAVISGRQFFWSVWYQVDFMVPFPSSW
jgi:hypothetical protein